MEKKLFVKIERGVVPKTIFDLSVPDHIAYVHALRKDGRRVESGYWAERGGGMMLFEAASIEEAEAIVAADPLVRSGCVEFELHEWRCIAPQE
ncbi:YciI family protein [Gloeobacter kilaueensis]|uniref:YciI n=1 Tax=Gloeobacter kilaueensis (strain ATCC BAA-2537 / CCAP 1431/1 / ULC 316 / JS1) TaxID=1183438 RepID=U5QK40_GLOK1|nr:YciI family protein [Gloeobacter kilaueensis]AGY58040.1 YciI [Gloeobacter kilaueensis JS1]